MRLNKMLLVGMIAVVVTHAQAAVKDHAVRYRLAIMQDGGLVHEIRRQSYGFRVEIVSDTDGVKPEAFKNGRPFVAATNGENYSVRLYNPLPVRVAVNLTVDGLNSITGKPSGITDGEKWMIDPYSSITIPGWQVSGAEARRFFFTEKPHSYAKWRGDVTGKDLSANCGVIGAAYFWNQEELDAYYDSNPIYRYTRQPIPYSNNYNYDYRAKKSEAKSSERMSDASANAPSAAPSAQGAMNQEMQSAEPVPQEQAGTGMGQAESNPTYQVDFHYDRGMYSPEQAVVIYYDFARPSSPNPFPELGYAPEMN